MDLKNTLFRNFDLNIIIRFIILLVLIFTLAFMVIETDLWALIFLILVFIVIFIVEFIRYVEKFKDHFLYFLNSINQEDFSVSFKEGKKRHKDEKLSVILNDLIEKFRKLRVEKESRHQYLNTVIDHINIGLISYNENGEITLINRAAKNILHKPHFKKIGSLKDTDPNLYHEIMNLTTREKSLVKIIRGNELYQISLQATEIKLDDGFEKVISMQDIKNELDERELESWQKLVRVINHEIMNSVIPISTLASVLNQMLTDYDNKDQVELKDIADGIKTIENRSKGLATFVDATKNLTRISKPVYRDITISDLFSRVERLMAPQISQDGIQLKFNQNLEKMTIKADLELIEQVLINLIKNAKESFENYLIEQRHIHILAQKKLDKVVITVSDNGKGIRADDLENIFIPFYTTKNEGSGIGLPLSRQIMRLHKGTIAIQTKEGEGTAVELIF